jgi:hypothetical protein
MPNYLIPTEVSSEDAEQERPEKDPLEIDIVFGLTATPRCIEEETRSGYDRNREALPLPCKGRFGSGERLIDLSGLPDGDRRNGTESSEKAIGIFDEPFVRVHGSDVAFVLYYNWKSTCDVGSLIRSLTDNPAILL